MKGQVTILDWDKRISDIPEKCLTRAYEKSN
jgi:hypothetical protein